MIKNPDNLPRGSGQCLADFTNGVAAASTNAASTVSIIGKLGYCSDTQDRGMSAAVDVDRLRFRRRLLV